MPKHRLSLEHRIKGARALLKSTKKIPEALKKGARELLRKNGYAVPLLLLALLAVPAHAQRSQTFYADQFYQNGQNPTVGAMDTAAQAQCNSNVLLPCVIINDSILAVYPAGVIPTPCAQCIFIDYRTTGQVKVANNASPTLTQVWPGGAVAFPLLQPAGSTCPALGYGTTADGTGFSLNTGQVWICNASTRRWGISAASMQAGSGGIFGWGSNVDPGVSGCCDTGISRDAAGVVDVGTGAQGSKAGTINATTANFTGVLTVGSCAGCGSASSIMVDSCTGTAAASGTLGFHMFGGNSAACVNAYSANNEMPMPRAGTIRNFRIKCSIGGVNASSGAFTFQKNNTAQTVTATLGTATTTSDLVNNFSFVAGDTIGIKYTTQAAETMQDCHLSWEVL